MLLPLAIIYNQVGIAKSVRYLKFKDRSYIDYNHDATFKLTPSCMNGAHVVELPVEDMRVPVSLGSIVLGTPYITRLDDNNMPVEDYTQVVASINTLITKESELFLVDYKGNILKTTLGTLSELVRNNGIKIGNLGARKQGSSFYAPEYTFDAVDCEAIYFVHKQRWHTHPLTLYSVRKKQNQELDNASCLMGKPAISKEGFTLEHIASDSALVLVPEGAKLLRISQSEYKLGNISSAIRSVVCPSILESVTYDMPNDKLKLFKSPIFISHYFKLCCHTLDKFIPPRVLFKKSVEGFVMHLNTFNQDSLTIPEAYLTAISIESAPSLKAICAPLTAILGLNIVILNASNVRSLILGSRYDMSGHIKPVSKSSYAKLAIAIGAQKYKITILEPVSTLRLAFPLHIKNCEIIVEHRGIDRLQYLNTSPDNKLILRNLVNKEQVPECELGGSIGNFYVPAATQLYPLQIYQEGRLL